MSRIGRHEFFGLLVREVRIGRFTATVRRYATGTAVPVHVHREPYVTIVIRGSYWLTRVRNEWECRAGSLVINRGDEPHAVRSAGGATCMFIHSDEPWPAGLFDHLAILATPSSTAIAEQLRDELRDPDAWSPMAFEATLGRLTVEVMRHRDQGRLPRWLRDARAILETNLVRPPDLDSLAAAVGVHPMHLSRVFRQHYRLTVHDCIRALRVEHVKESIRSGVPLSTAAREAGFADQSHMTRTFRALTEMTPAAFRRSLHRSDRRHARPSEGDTTPSQTSAELLFSYGTLQLDAVQMATFGRRLTGTRDALPGFRQKPLTIEDEVVVAVSGKTYHTIATFTGLASDVLFGTVFAVTPRDIQNADRHAGGAYERVARKLQSGLRAWVYVDPQSIV